MTFWKKSWDLYICRYIIEDITSESNEKNEKVIKKSHYIRLELFQSENPETAYEKAILMIPELNHVYRDDNGNTVMEECLGISELDLLQDNLTSFTKELKELGSYHIDSITDKDLHIDPTSLIRKKEGLTLFDENYNYKTEHNKK